MTTSTKIKDSLSVPKGADTSSILPLESHLSSFTEVEKQAIKQLASVFVSAVMNESKR